MTVSKMLLKGPRNPFFTSWIALCRAYARAISRAFRNGISAENIFLTTSSPRCLVGGWVLVAAGSRRGLPWCAACAAQGIGLRAAGPLPLGPFHVKAFCEPLSASVHAPSHSEPVCVRGLKYTERTCSKPAFFGGLTYSERTCPKQVCVGRRCVQNVRARSQSA